VQAKGDDMSDREKLMALRDASVDARRKAALGLDMGDPNSLETLTRTHTRNSIRRNGCHIGV